MKILLGIQSGDPFGLVCLQPVAREYMQLPGAALAQSNIGVAK